MKQVFICDYYVGGSYKETLANGETLNELYNIMRAKNLPLPQKVKLIMELSPEKPFTYCQNSFLIKIVDEATWAERVSLIEN